MTRCRCGRPVAPPRRRYCSQACADAAHLAGRAARWHATATRRHVTRRDDWRNQAGAARLDAAIRARAAAGEPCYFHHRPGYEQCPGRIDLRLDGRVDRWAFTVHHLVRIMDGGPAVPHTALAAPAHRACNARDGLLQQNGRRSGSPSVVTRRDGGPMTQGDMGVPPVGRTSEDWS